MFININKIHSRGVDQLHPYGYQIKRIVEDAISLKGYRVDTNIFSTRTCLPAGTVTRVGRMITDFLFCEAE